MSRHHRQLHRGRWEAVRREVLERDLYRCRQCGKAGRLEVDHIVPLHTDPHQDPYKLAGLQTLCYRCHAEKTRGELGHTDPARDRWRSLVQRFTDSCS